MRREVFPFFAAALSACWLAPVALAESHDALIAKHASVNGVPEQLVRRVIRIESGGNAAAMHKGNYGLMQIRLGTARGVGYSGDAQGLLDPDTNLTYAVKYLAGAYRAAGCDADRAVSYYQRGYYGSARVACGSPSTVVQLAQAEPLKPEGRAARKGEAAATKRKPETEPASLPDVIKPKVVRTESIATSNSNSAPARPVGNFEPKRVAPPLPPSQPVLAKPLPSKPEPAATKPAAPETKPSFELASVPLPQARPEFDTPPKPDAKPVGRSTRTHDRADPKIKVDTSTKSADPTGVFTFLKKLVTPDNKPRRQTLEAEAQPSSQVQPPQ